MMSTDESGVVAYSEWRYSLMDGHKPGSWYVECDGPAGQAIVSIEMTDGRACAVTASLAASRGTMSQLLQRLPISKIEAWATVQIGLGPGATELDERTLDLHIQVPTSRPYGDDFYSELAWLYMRAATWSRRPAVEIASVNGVPVTSVHSWVKEARRRCGFPFGIRDLTG